MMFNGKGNFKKKNYKESSNRWTEIQTNNLTYRRALKLIKPTFYMIIVITYMCWNLGLDKVALNY